ncbi:MAG: GNAT family N-acetyltransferase [Phycisphaerae bacterium]|nr:GNAT family N-acetyltransferase [Phycisphaerae bacterium]
MDNNPIIRSARVTDIPVITEFLIAQARESEGLRLDPDTARRGVAHAVAHPQQGRYFVAECDGRVVGQLMITSEWSDWRAKVFWWIQSVYVHPDYRGQSVFRRLYRHVESLARQDPGVCGIRLYVHRNNHGAMAAYERLGMTPTGYRVYETTWSEAGKDEG